MPGRLSMFDDKIKSNSVYSMKRYFISIAVATIAASLMHAQSKDDLSGVVTTDAGAVSGVLNNDRSVVVYKGIPYAAAPVGALRWKAPQSVKPWTETRKCDHFGASPIQGKPVPFMMYTAEFLIPAEPISEDCLYLNIWTKTGSAEKKPVIVWIHGGAFVSGSGSCPIYDGEDIAKKGVVFVTINYRLGVFGFLALDELTKESPTHSSGNYAFQDQIAALQWVKKNIAQFGGDPDRVTIAGQSAGSFSVNALAASPVAKGLFQRVIAESGGMFNRDGRILTLDSAEQTGKRIMEKVNAASIEDMRKKPADELLKATGMGMMSPVIDGYVLPGPVYDIYDNVQQNDVAVLTGWNRDEGFPQGAAASPEIYKSNAVKQYNELAGEFLKAYPGNTPDEIKRSQLEWSRNNLFAWHAYTWARLETEKGKNKVFLYQFNRVPPQDEQYGAFHSAEISYALHTLHMWNRPWTTDDRKLEDIMSSYWVNFASSGNPNGQGLPEWKPFDVRSPSLIQLDYQNIGMKPMPYKAEFDFIDKYQEQIRRK